MTAVCRLTNISYAIGNTPIVSSLTWNIDKGKIYAVLGGNGTGKTVLAEIIAGRRPPDSGEIYLPPMLLERKIGYLSFEEQEEVLARERRLDETWLGDGSIDYGSTAAELIGVNRADSDVIRYSKLLGIEHLLDRGCRQYSTGEFRKVLLCRELLKTPPLLLLDEPYDGLDEDSRNHVREVIPHVREQGTTVLFFLHRKDEVPPYADETLYLYNHGLQLEPPPSRSHHTLIYDAAPEAGTESGKSDPVIVMEGVEVFYSGKPVLQEVTWQADERETWMITGPNGSGKSTLLSLINGDNPKAYGQEIYLFGRRRGTGESVWDIKKEIGFVSGDLQFRYFIRSIVIDVVLSGLFDSIGLYTKTTDFERHAAEYWLSCIGLENKQNEPFQNLSFGEQRMVLLARAMIKSPKLLIVDEPCQGLDDINREDVLRSLEAIASKDRTLLLYVTHEPKEYLHVPYRHMKLIPYKAGGYTAKEIL